MRPQDDEPCVFCKHWNDESGCSLGRYDSPSMQIFGHCGFCKKREPEEDTKA